MLNATQHTTKLQNPHYSPPALRTEKRNLGVYRQEKSVTFTRLFSREIFSREWQCTRSALKIYENAERSLLAEDLINNGFYWLKTGRIRNARIPSGAHRRQEIYQQTGYEVHDYKVLILNIG